MKNSKNSRSHSPQDANSKACLKESNYNLHRLLQKPNRPTSHSHESTEKPETFLHYNYLSNEIQDALKFTKKKIWIEKNIAFTNDGNPPARKQPLVSEDYAEPQRSISYD